MLKNNWVAAGNVDKGGDAMMVFDYNNNDKGNGEITFTDSLVKSETGYVSNAVFLNYPKLDFIDLRLVNCQFINCNHIGVYDEKMMNCTFDNIETLFATRMEISGCTFRNLHCDRDTVFLEDSKLDMCQICDSEFINDAYFCEGMDSSRVSFCTVENCKTDRQDRQLFRGFREVRRLFKKVEVEQDIVDIATKNSLKNVIYIG